MMSGHFISFIDNFSYAVSSEPIQGGNSRWLKTNFTETLVTENHSTMHL